MLWPSAFSSFVWTTSGDVVLSMSVLRGLRQWLPAARITLVVKPQLVNLVERCPYVDEVLAFDPSRAGRIAGRPYFRLLSFCNSQLWPRKFDLAVVPRFDWDRYYALPLCYASGAARRVGFAADRNLHARGDFFFDEFLTQRIEREQGVKHEVLRNLDVLKFLGAPIADDKLELWTDAQDEQFAADFFKQHGAIGAPIVAFGIGAAEAKRRWPIERFAGSREGARSRSRCAGCWRLARKMMLQQQRNCGSARAKMCSTPAAVRRCDKRSRSCADASFSSVMTADRCILLPRLAFRRRSFMSSVEWCAGAFQFAGTLQPVAGAVTRVASSCRNRAMHGWLQFTDTPLHSADFHSRCSGRGGVLVGAAEFNGPRVGTRDYK